MTTSCAGFARPSAQTAETAPPPQIPVPADARKACALYTLPPAPTRADLEIGFASRGLQLIECDGRRELAVLAADEEDARQAEWARARACRRASWWRPWEKIAACRD